MIISTIIFVLVLATIFYRYSMSTRCPNCGYHALHPAYSNDFIYCKKCRDVFTRQMADDFKNIKDKEGDNEAIFAWHLTKDQQYILGENIDFRKFNDEFPMSYFEKLYGFSASSVKSSVLIRSEYDHHRYSIVKKLMNGRDAYYNYLEGHGLLVKFYKSNDVVGRIMELGGNKGSRVSMSDVVRIGNFNDDLVCEMYDNLIESGINPFHGREFLSWQKFFGKYDRDDFFDRPMFSPPSN